MNGMRGLSPITRRRYRIALAILVFAISLFYGYFWLLSPSVNPNPHKKVVLRGAFPFNRGWDLRIQQSYFAQNPTCNQVARVFFLIPQADVSRERMLPLISVSQLPGFRYEVEYFEDHFLPGFCNWQANFTYYRIYANSNIVQGGAMLGLPNMYNRIDYDCRDIQMPKTRELVMTCHEGNNRSLDPSRKDNEVNFFWKEISK